MMQPAFSVCVYCGSRPGTAAAYAEAARTVGHWIGVHGGQLVYGGGHNGLMGIVADAALEAGAHVVGVIPQALVEKEWAHKGCHELRVVDTMHERKRIMAERAEVFLALPGGIGTFEEFFEAWTWRQLGYHDKPVGLLNVDGLYNGLLDMLRTLVDQQFLTTWQMDLICVHSDAEALLRMLLNTGGLPGRSRLDQI